MLFFTAPDALYSVALIKRANERRSRPCGILGSSSRALISVCFFRDTAAAATTVSHRQCSIRGNADNAEAVLSTIVDEIESSRSQDLQWKEANEMIEKFNFYDLYAYFLPGVILLTLMIIPFALTPPVTFPSSVQSGVFALVLSYVFGYLVQSIARDLFPSKVRKGGKERYPSQVLLDDRRRAPFE